MIKCLQPQLTTHYLKPLQNIAGSAPLSSLVSVVSSHQQPSVVGDAFQLNASPLSSMVGLSSPEVGDSQLSGLRKMIAVHIKATFSYFW